MKHFLRAIILGAATPFIVLIVAFIILQLGNITGAGHNVGFALMRDVFSAEGEKLRRIMLLAASFAWGGFFSVLYFSMQIEMGLGWIGMILWAASFGIASLGFAYLGPSFGMRTSFGGGLFGGLLMSGMGSVFSVWALIKLDKSGFLRLKRKHLA
jgi:hypothetical protein